MAASRPSGISVLSKLFMSLMALREIAAGKVRFNRNSRDAVEEYILELKARYGHT